ncbi:hypothetical protein FPZ12_014325 [Amycolatopsis acidicola]|uniref:Uncharacterized protein n=1 Tax=Amycolatopsis acidicola TaxID=2596893 RepID=A0A5N0V9V6_9PSEU|nr:toxin glutamine deamidase domain-containing protein [Amycolatopsis acidicola]KAA9161322.1 hypothetical protein FPZ12_014325 [Amycolatopsis acidicola]
MADIQPPTDSLLWTYVVQDGGYPMVTVCTPEGDVSSPSYSVWEPNSETDAAKLSVSWGEISGALDELVNATRPAAEELKGEGVWPDGHGYGVSFAIRSLNNDPGGAGYLAKNAAQIASSCGNLAQVIIARKQFVIDTIRKNEANFELAGLWGATAEGRRQSRRWYAKHVADVIAGQLGGRKSRGLLDWVTEAEAGAFSAVAGNLEGLTELIGFDWQNGWSWENAGHAWKTLAALGAIGSPIGVGMLALNEFTGLPGLRKGEYGDTLVNAGKTFVGWNDWKDDPAFAGGELAGNIGAVLALRGASSGAASGLRAFATAAKASRFAAVAKTGAALESLLNLPKVSDLAVSGFKNLPKVAEAGKGLLGKDRPPVEADSPYPKPTSGDHSGGAGGNASHNTPETEVPAKADQPLTENPQVARPSDETIPHTAENVRPTGPDTTTNSAGHQNPENVTPSSRPGTGPDESPAAGAAQTPKQPNPMPGGAEARPAGSDGGQPGVEPGNQPGEVPPGSHSSAPEQPHPGPSSPADPAAGETPPLSHPTTAAGESPVGKADDLSKIVMRTASSDSGPHFLQKLSEDARNGIRFNNIARVTEEMSPFHRPGEETSGGTPPKTTGRTEKTSADRGDVKDALSEEKSRHSKPRSGKPQGNAGEQPHPEADTTAASNKPSGSSEGKPSPNTTSGDGSPASGGHREDPSHPPESGSEARADDTGEHPHASEQSSGEPEGEVRRRTPGEIYADKLKYVDKADLTNGTLGRPAQLDTESHFKELPDEPGGGRTTPPHRGGPDDAPSSGAADGNSPNPPPKPTRGGGAAHQGDNVVRPQPGGGTKTALRERDEATRPPQPEPPQPAAASASRPMAKPAEAPKPAGASADAMAAKPTSEVESLETAADPTTQGEPLHVRIIKKTAEESESGELPRAEPPEPPRQPQRNFRDPDGAEPPTGNPGGDASSTRPVGDAGTRRPARLNLPLGLVGPLAASSAPEPLTPPKVPDEINPAQPFEVTERKPLEYRPADPLDGRQKPVVPNALPVVPTKPANPVSPGDFPNPDSGRTPTPDLPYHQPPQPEEPAPIEMPARPEYDSSATPSTPEWPETFPARINHPDQLPPEIPAHPGEGVGGPDPNPAPLSDIPPEVLEQLTDAEREALRKLATEMGVGAAQALHLILDEIIDQMLFTPRQGEPRRRISRGASLADKLNFLTEVDERDQLGEKLAERTGTRPAKPRRVPPERTSKDKPLVPTSWGGSGGRIRYRVVRPELEMPADAPDGLSRGERLLWFVLPPEIQRRFAERIAEVGIEQAKRELAQALDRVSPGEGLGRILRLSDEQVAAMARLMDTTAAGGKSLFFTTKKPIASLKYSLGVIRDRLRREAPPADDWTEFTDAQLEHEILRMLTMLRLADNSLRHPDRFQDWGLRNGWVEDPRVNAATRQEIDPSAGKRLSAMFGTALSGMLALEDYTRRRTAAGDVPDLESKRDEALQLAQTAVDILDHFAGPEPYALNEEFPGSDVRLRDAKQFASSVRTELAKFMGTRYESDEELNAAVHRLEAAARDVSEAAPAENAPTPDIRIAFRDGREVWVELVHRPLQTGTENLRRVGEGLVVMRQIAADYGRTPEFYVVTTDEADPDAARGLIESGAADGVLGLDANWNNLELLAKRDAPASTPPEAASLPSPEAGFPEDSPLTVRELSELPDLQKVSDHFNELFKPEPGAEPMPLDRLLAFSEGGFYIAGAFSGKDLVGASVAFIGERQGERVVHLHVTGVVEGAGGQEAGRMLAANLQDWALRRGVEKIDRTHARYLPRKTALPSEPTETPKRPMEQARAQRFEEAEDLWKAAGLLSALGNDVSVKDLPQLGSALLPLYASTDEEVHTAAVVSSLITDGTALEHLWQPGTFNAPDQTSTGFLEFPVQSAGSTGPGYAVVVAQLDSREDADRQTLLQRVQQHLDSLPANDPRRRFLVLTGEATTGDPTWLQELSFQLLNQGFDAIPIHRPGQPVEILAAKENLLTGQVTRSMGPFRPVQARELAQWLADRAATKHQEHQNVTNQRAEPAQTPASPTETPTVVPVAPIASQEQAASEPGEGSTPRLRKEKATPLIGTIKVHSPISTIRGAWQARKRADEDVVRSVIQAAATAADVRIVEDSSVPMPSEQAWIIDSGGQKFVLQVIHTPNIGYSEHNPITFQVFPESTSDPSMPQIVLRQPDWLPPELAVLPIAHTMAVGGDLLAAQAKDRDAVPLSQASLYEQNLRYDQFPGRALKLKPTDRGHIAQVVAMGILVSQARSPLARRRMEAHLERLLSYLGVAGEDPYSAIRMRALEAYGTKIFMSTPREKQDPALVANSALVVANAYRPAEAAEGYRTGNWPVENPAVEVSYRLPMASGARAFDRVSAVENAIRKNSDQAGSRTRVTLVPAGADLRYDVFDGDRKIFTTVFHVLPGRPLEASGFSTHPGKQLLSVYLPARTRLRDVEGVLTAAIAYGTQYFTKATLNPHSHTLHANSDLDRLPDGPIDRAFEVRIELLGDRIARTPPRRPWRRRQLISELRALLERAGLEKQMPGYGYRLKSLSAKAQQVVEEFAIKRTNTDYLPTWFNVLAAIFNDSPATLAMGTALTLSAVHVGPLGNGVSYLVSGLSSLLLSAITLRSFSIANDERAARARKSLEMRAAIDKARAIGAATPWPEDDLVPTDDQLPDEEVDIALPLRRLGRQFSLPALLGLLAGYLVGGLMGMTKPTALSQLSSAVGTMVLRPLAERYSRRKRKGAELAAQDSINREDAQKVVEEVRKLYQGTVHAFAVIDAYFAGEELPAEAVTELTPSPERPDVDGPNLGVSGFQWGAAVASYIPLMPNVNKVANPALDTDPVRFLVEHLGRHTTVVAADLARLAFAGTVTALIENRTALRELEHKLTRLAGALRANREAKIPMTVGDRDWLLREIAVEALHIVARSAKSGPAGDRRLSALGEVPEELKELLGVIRSTPPKLTAPISRKGPLSRLEYATFILLNSITAGTITFGVSVLAGASAYYLWGGVAAGLAGVLTAIGKPFVRVREMVAENRAGTPVEQKSDREARENRYLLEKVAEAMLRDFAKRHGEEFPTVVAEQISTHLDRRERRALPAVTPLTKFEPILVTDEDLQSETWSPESRAELKALSEIRHHTTRREEVREALEFLARPENQRPGGWSHEVREMLDILAPPEDKEPPEWSPEAWPTEIQEKVEFLAQSENERPGGWSREVRTKQESLTEPENQDWPEKIRGKLESLRQSIEVELGLWGFRPTLEHSLGLLKDVLPPLIDGIEQQLRDYERRGGFLTNRLATVLRAYLRDGEGDLVQQVKGVLSEHKATNKELPSRLKELVEHYESTRQAGLRARLDDLVRGPSRDWDQERQLLGRIVDLLNVEAHDDGFDDDRLAQNLKMILRWSETHGDDYYARQVEGLLRLSSEGVPLPGQLAVLLRAFDENRTRAAQEVMKAIHELNQRVDEYKAGTDPMRFTDIDDPGLDSPEPVYKSPLQLKSDEIAKAANVPARRVLHSRFIGNHITEERVKATREWRAKQLNAVKTNVALARWSPKEKGIAIRPFVTADTAPPEVLESLRQEKAPLLTQINRNYNSLFAGFRGYRSNCVAAAVAYLYTLAGWKGKTAVPFSKTLPERATLTALWERVGGTWHAHGSWDDLVEPMTGDRGAVSAVAVLSRGSNGEMKRHVFVVEVDEDTGVPMAWDPMTGCVARVPTRPWMILRLPVEMDALRSMEPIQPPEHGMDEVPKAERSAIYRGEPPLGPHLRKLAAMSPLAEFVPPSPPSDAGFIDALRYGLASARHAGWRGVPTLIPKPVPQPGPPIVVLTHPVHALPDRSKLSGKTKAHPKYHAVDAETVGRKWRARKWAADFFQESHPDYARPFPGYYGAARRPDGTVNLGYLQYWFGGEDWDFGLDGFDDVIRLMVERPFGSRAEVVYVTAEKDGSRKEHLVHVTHESYGVGLFDRENGWFAHPSGNIVEVGMLNYTDHFLPWSKRPQPSDQPWFTAPKGMLYAQGLEKKTAQILEWPGRPPRSWHPSEDLWRRSPLARITENHWLPAIDDNRYIYDFEKDEFVRQYRPRFAQPDPYYFGPGTWNPDGTVDRDALVAKFGGTWMADLTIDEIIFQIADRELLSEGVVHLEVSNEQGKREHRLGVVAHDTYGVAFFDYSDPASPRLLDLSGDLVRASLLPYRDALRRPLAADDGRYVSYAVNADSGPEPEVRALLGENVPELGAPENRSQGPEECVRWASEFMWAHAGVPKEPKQYPPEEAARWSTLDAVQKEFGGKWQTINPTDYGYLFDAIDAFIDTMPDRKEDAAAVLAFKGAGPNGQEIRHATAVVVTKDGVQIYVDPQAADATRLPVGPEGVYLLLIDLAQLRSGTIELRPDGLDDLPAEERTAIYRGFYDRAPAPKQVSVGIMRALSQAGGYVPRDLKKN